MSNEIIKREEGITVVACPHPLKVQNVHVVLPVGLTIQQILEIVQPDEILRMHSFIYLNDRPIHEGEYNNVIPHVDDHITIRVVPGKGKDILGIAITIATIAGSIYLGGLPALSGQLIGGLTYGRMAGALLSGIGMLAKAALVSPASMDYGGLSGTASQESPTLSINGARNSERPWGVVPVVLGKHKVVPPLGASSFTEIVGDDEHLTMLVIWGYGPLNIGPLKIGETLIIEADGTKNFDDVEIETHEGRSTDPTFKNFLDIVEQEPVSVKLEEDASPDWTLKTTKLNCDEISIDFTFPKGLVHIGDSGERYKLQVDAEIRYRLTSTITGSITAIINFFVSGTVLVTSPAHGRSTADSLTFSGTGEPNYNGDFKITVIDENTFYIFATYVSDESSGSWVGAYITPNPTVSSDVTLEATAGVKTSIGTLNDLNGTNFDSGGDLVDFLVTDSILTDITDTGLAQTITENITQTSFSAVATTKITATVSGRNSSQSLVDAVQVIVEGTDKDGAFLTETLPAFSSGTYGTVQGSSGFATVTSVFIPAHDTSGSTQPLFVEFSNKTTSAYRIGFRWKAPNRDQYDVEVRRTTVAPTSLSKFDELWWSTIRTITNENPLNFDFPVAATVLKIKATDQLNGVVDELSAVCSSYSPKRVEDVAITALVDYSGTVAGTVKITSVNHGLTGGSVDIISLPDGDYDGSHSITKIDSDNFYITSAYFVETSGTWTGWIDTFTSNPASLFYHVLTHPAMATPLAVSRLDLPNLETWYDFCETNGGTGGPPGLEFNQVRDYQTSVWELLTDIARVGYSSPTQTDGLWGVVTEHIGSSDPIPTQHFTPRNSSGFEAEKKFIDIPHALRVRFTNEDEGYKQDELIVYNDGYSVDGNDVDGNPTLAIATDFEQLSALGITDETFVWYYGRFFLVQISLRPEQYIINSDFEYLVSNRGDMVLLTHDILLVGLASARIKALQTDGTGDTVSITVDETFTMESGESYGVSIRTLNDTELTKSLVLNVGDNTNVTFTSPIAAASSPVVGDIVAFATSGLETLKTVVLAIEPQKELSARLTLAPFIPNIIDAVTGTIPEFQTQITPLDILPSVEVVGEPRTDESVLVLGEGNTLWARIAIEVVPAPNHLGATLEAQIRGTGTNAEFVVAKFSYVSNNEVMIEDVQARVDYDVRLRWVNYAALFQSARIGNWNTINGITVVGQTSAPPALQNLQIQSWGGNALLSWDLPDVLDVMFGGTVKFRHNNTFNAGTDLSSTTWITSNKIGNPVAASATFASLPLVSGTYLGKVFDRGGRSSAVAKVSLRNTDARNFGNLETIQEDPGFSGTHSNTQVVSSHLELTTTGIDVDPAGTYTFTGTLDVGSLLNIRLRTELEVLVLSVNDDIDDWVGLVDDREDWDGVDPSAAEAIVEVRTTEQDPTGSPTWSPWTALYSSYFSAWGAEFRIKLTTTDPAININISTLKVHKEERFVF